MTIAYALVAKLPHFRYVFDSAPIARRIATLTLIGLTMLNSHADISPASPRVGDTVTITATPPSSYCYFWGNPFQPCCGPFVSLSAGRWRGPLDPYGTNSIYPLSSSAIVIPNVQPIHAGQYSYSAIYSVGAPCYATLGFSFSEYLIVGSSDLAATVLRWNTNNGGTDLAYSCTGLPLPVATTAKLFWANGTNITNILSPTPIFSTNIASGFTGLSRTNNIAALLLQNPPSDTTHILLVVDPGNLVAEADKTNNVRSIAWPPFKLKLLGHICDDCPSLLQVTNLTQPSIFRYGGSGPNPQKGYGLRVEVAAPSNITFRLYVQAVTNSGGHDHSDTQRKHGWLFPGSRTWASLMKPTAQGGLMGKMTAGGTNGYSTYEDVLEVNSGPSGLTNLIYVAPEISGTEQIIISSTNALPAQRLTLTNLVVVRVPDLIPLTANEVPVPYCAGCDADVRHFSPNGSATFKLIGGRCAHTSGWNGTTNMVKAIRALATNYVAQGLGQRLKVNDLALPWGGMFDIGPGLCANETAQNPFWEAGKHFGHRLGTEVDIGIPSNPPNTNFQRMILAQGWWLPNVMLWTNEGNHYHLNLSGSGKVTIEPARQNPVVTQDWHSASMVLTLAVALENQGGLDANEVTVESLSASSGVTILSPSLPLSLGSMNIRQVSPVTVRATIPNNVHSFSLSLKGTATSPDAPGKTNVFKVMHPSIKVPATSPLFSQKDFAQLGRFAAAPGDWSFEMFPTDQPAVVGTNLVYNATIHNNTGMELFVSDLSLWFLTPAAEGSYELDWAPEFFAIGGAIGASGYSGPLVTLRWLSPPPAGSVSYGEIELATDSLVPTPLLHATVRSGAPGIRLDISYSTNGMVCSWPAIPTGQGLWLESASSPDETEWNRVPEAVFTAGGTNSVTVTVGTGAEFFRLSGQW